MKYIGLFDDKEDIVTKEKLETKQNKITGAATTITDDNLTANRALISNSSGKVAVSAVTSTELGYLDGVTSNVQTQLNKKLESAPVTSVNGATGEVKSTFYVTVTQGDDGSVTADKTAAEVYAAYAAGYAVYANIQGTILPLAVAVSDPGLLLLGFGTALSNDQLSNPQYATVLYDGNAWLAWIGTLARLEDIPAHLPNQFPLDIKIGNTTTSYDGSAAKTVEIPEGVPSVTTADNGKFLRVVSGAWAAATLGKSDVGLGSVDNVRQYSASNPPPYPVTSVNGQTGAVTLSASDVSAIPSTLTGTAGQVLTKTADGQEWKDAQSGGITATQYTFTLLSGNWITDIGYKIQQVTVTGLKQNYPISPDVDCVLSGTDADGDTAILEGWALVQFAETASDKITFKCIGDAPTVNIPVVLRVFE